MMKDISKMEILITDVLVVGSGVAGLRAAIEANKYGLDTMLVDKSLIARNSISAFAGGTMRPSDTVLMTEEEKKKVDNALSWMNPTRKGRFYSSLLGGWAEPYCKDEKMEEIILNENGILEDEAVDFGVKYPRGTIWYHPPCRGFTPFILPMAEYCKKEGVRTRTHLFIIDLIKNGDTVVGAVGLDLKTGGFVTIKAKATVLATGGAAECWARNNVPQVATGDGVAMAYRAGLTIGAIENMQFDAWIWAEPGLPMWWIHQCIPRRRGVPLNNKGETFVDKYIPDDRMHNPTFNPDDIWDVRYGGTVIPYVAWISKAMANEVREGRGDNGAVLVDFTRAKEEEWLASPHALANYNMFRDFDWKHRPVHVFPGALATDGGIKHGEYGETNLKGLYAAGEVGPPEDHGFAGLVWGRRAGMGAARYAKEAKTPEVDEKLVNDMTKEAEAVMKRPETEEGEPKYVRKLIKDLMMKYVGPVRTGSELKQAIEEIEKIQREYLPKLWARNPIQLRQALEVRNMAIFGELVARTALLREETRGNQTRLDFPYMDNEKWLKFTTVRLNTVTRKPEFGTEPIVKTWGLTPPPGKIPEKGFEKYWDGD
jgi:succinate dehydrogenase/fumarate reductase flavoprotein subunit